MRWTGHTLADFWDTIVLRCFIEFMSHPESLRPDRLLLPVWCDCEQGALSLELRLPTCFTSRADQRTIWMNRVKRSVPSWSAVIGVHIHSRLFACSLRFWKIGNFEPLVVVIATSEGRLLVKIEGVFLTLRQNVVFQVLIDTSHKEADLACLIVNCWWILHVPRW